MSSSHQPRRYRLVDHHGQPHLELDEHFDSIEEAWAFATRWTDQSDMKVWGPEADLLRRHRAEARREGGI